MGVKKEGRRACVGDACSDAVPEKWDWKAEVRVDGGCEICIG